MGCGKICKAKKKAAEAQKKADRSKKDAENKKNEALEKARSEAKDGKNSVISIEYYTVEVITIGKFLGVDSKQNALSIRDMVNLFHVAQRSPEIMASAVAKGLIQPLLGFFDFYNAFSKAIAIFQALKPGVKILMQIGDIITFNWSAFGELIGDIVQMLAQLMLGFAPMLIEMLKNIFLNIPLYTKKIPKKQKIRIQGLLVLKNIKIKEDITNAIIDYTPQAPFCATKMTRTCPDILESVTNIKTIEINMNISLESYVQNSPFPSLEDLTDVNVLDENIIVYMTKGMKCTERDVLKKIIKASKQESISVVSLPEIATSTPEEKQSLGQALDGLLTAYEKTEAAITEELLRQNFVVSQQLPKEEKERFSDNMLSEELSRNVIKELRKVLVTVLKKYNKTNGSIHPKIDICRLLTYELKKEVDKKLKRIEDKRQDLITLNVTKELIESNKLQIFDNLIKSFSNVGFDPQKITLDNSMTDEIENDFSNLKNNINLNNNTTISNTTVNNTNDMLDLRDLIVSNSNTDVNDENIVPDTSLGFSDDVCRNIEGFKKELVLEIENKMRKSSINTSDTFLPSYANKKKIADMVDLFYDKIVTELILMVKKIILEQAIPCKSCRPCEKMVEDLVFLTETKIDGQKDKIIDNVNQFVLDDNLDWTITDAASIVEKKQQLIDVSTNSINKNIGVINLYDVFILKLKKEEAAIIDTIARFIKSS